MLLGLASGNTFLDGDEHSTNIPSVSHDLILVAKQAFYDFGERPLWADRIYGRRMIFSRPDSYGFSSSLADDQRTIHYSGRREGLVIYFARLVRPVWKSKLTKPG